MAQQSFQLISHDNEVFCSFVIWNMVLVMKMLIMTLLTAMQRLRKKAFANPEDAAMRKMEVKSNDPHVERVRRAHLNDMENILLFILTSFVYVLTGPKPAAAMWIFRVSAVSRIIHTCVYAFYPVPQPARAICFFVPFLCTWFMAIRTLIYFIC